MNEEEQDTHQSKEELLKLEEAQSRMIYDLDNNTIDFRAKRATDMDHNMRLMLPEPRSAMEEAVLSARVEVWHNAVKAYMREHCNKEGTQDHNNLTAGERIGLLKLKKRIKAGEITVLQSDKRNIFVVSSVYIYQRQGDIHTRQDRRVQPGKKEQTQARMNNVACALAKVFRIGENWGECNAAQCWNNVTTESMVVPLL